MHKHTRRIWRKTRHPPSLLSGSQAKVPQGKAKDKGVPVATHTPVSITNGAEIAGTVLVFFLLGWFIDRQLDTTPWFMIALVLVAIVAQFLKLYYVYSAQMTSLEAQRRAAVHAK